MKYVVFDDNQVGRTYQSKRAAMHFAQTSNRFTIAEVTDDGRILNMWNTKGEAFKFESHGGDHGSWREPS